SQRTESPQLRLSIKTQTRQDVADTPTGQKACIHRRAQAARGATRGGRGRPGCTQAVLSCPLKDVLDPSGLMAVDQGHITSDCTGGAPQVLSRHKQG
ncbi:MAG: hypothetical protein ACPIOQ_20145, partial [Promethearchaeia archaeon]